MSDLPNNDLEIKLAFLERHIEEQDKVVYGLSKEIDTLKRELTRIGERIAQSNSDGPELSADERPPHY